MAETTCRICDSIKTGRIFNTDGRLALRRCRVCGAVFLNSFPSAEKTSRMYSTAYYSNLLNSNVITESRYRRLLRRISGGKAPGSLLEVGCGAGSFLKTAKNIGWDATGIDISESSVSWCKNQLGLKVFRADLVEAAFAADSFDAVVILEAIEHVQRPLAYLEEAHRILRPGGTLVISTPNFDSFSRVILGRRWSGLNPSHLFYFTPRVMRDILKKAGFAGLRIESRNIDIPQIRRRLFGNNPVSREEIAEERRNLRAKIEMSRPLAVLKALLNFALNLSGRGDSIWAYAIKMGDS